MALVIHFSTSHIGIISNESPRVNIHCRGVSVAKPKTHLTVGMSARDNNIDIPKNRDNKRTLFLNGLEQNILL